MIAVSTDVSVARARGTTRATTAHARRETRALAARGSCGTRHTTGVALSFSSWCCRVDERNLVTLDPRQTIGRLGRSSDAGSSDLSGASVPALRIEPEALDSGPSCERAQSCLAKIAVDNNSIYWTNFQSGQIMKLAKPPQ